MLELPRSTEFNKRIPKQKFYVNLQITPALKKSFVDQIKVIHWKNKIAAIEDLFVDQVVTFRLFQPQ